MSKKEFVDEMIRVSYIRFYNFVKLFNLDPTLFNHLSNIRFIFKKMISYGSYNPSENIITINEKIMNVAYNLKINNKLTDEIRNYWCRRNGLPLRRHVARKRGLQSRLY